MRVHGCPARHRDPGWRHPHDAHLRMLDTSLQPIPGVWLALSGLRARRAPGGISKTHRPPWSLPSPANSPSKCPSAIPSAPPGREHLTTDSGGLPMTDHATPASPGPTSRGPRHHQERRQRSPYRSRGRRSSSVTTARTTTSAGRFPLSLRRVRQQPFCDGTHAKNGSSSCQRMTRGSS
jgi:hypothetical protein